MSFVEVKDGVLCAWGKGTYQIRDWLRAQGATYIPPLRVRRVPESDPDAIRPTTEAFWKFPQDTKVTVGRVKSQLQTEYQYREYRKQVQRQKCTNLAKGRATQARYMRDLKDPVKA